MSELTQDGYTITIAGEERPFALNMGALQVIADNGYSGEDGEPDFEHAFDAATGNDQKAARLVTWAGLLAPFMDDEGVIDFKAAPKLTVTNRMTLGELMEAAATATIAYLGMLPRGTIEALAAAQKEAEKKAASEKAGRPTRAPRKK